MKALEHLALLQLVRDHCHCSEHASFITTPVLHEALMKHGKKGEREIHDAVKQDVSSLSNLGGNHQSVKHLLVVAHDGEVHFIWFQIHTEYIQRPPMRYSPYPRAEVRFVWNLHAIAATKENCHSQQFQSAVSSVQSNRIPPIKDILLSSPLSNIMRAACIDSPHIVIRSIRQ